MKRVLVIALMTCVMLLSMSTASASAHSIMRPLHPSCDTVPNNTDCNGQPTPGGCSNSQKFQGVTEQLVDSTGHLMLTVQNIYSTHCMSNYPQVTCFNTDNHTGTYCYTQTQRYSGPDGGGFTLSSSVIASPSEYEGVLVYAPNNQTSVRACGQDAAQPYYTCSAWTPAW